MFLLHLIIILIAIVITIIVAIIVIIILIVIFKYNWEELTVNGGLNKLTVSELDKYLNYYRLPKSGKSWTKLSVSPVTHADQTPDKCNLWLQPGRYVMKTETPPVMKLQKLQKQRSAVWQAHGEMCLFNSMLNLVITLNLIL